jgi:V/A-type H+-transporting ATPase subunit B
MRLSEHIYRTISSIGGPLVFVDNVFSARIGEVVTIVYPDNRRMDGEILKIDGETVLIQVYGDTRGLDVADSSVIFSETVKLAPLSPDIIGRVFNGSFLPMDGMPLFIPEKQSPITGFPINPSARARPEEFIETGFSCIDGLNTLVKGQKLPIFSAAGLPSKEMAAGILRNARLADEAKRFVVVFAALGLTFREYSFYRTILQEMRTGFVAFVNMADDPVMERLLTPRFALTVSEYLAFELGMDVLVVITDMTNYCDALREVSTAREELRASRATRDHVFGPRLAHERAGRVKGLGSVTMLSVLTSAGAYHPPRPDLTGYITEGRSCSP